MQKLILTMKKAIREFFLIAFFRVEKNKDLCQNGSFRDRFSRPTPTILTY